MVNLQKQMAVFLSNGFNKNTADSMDICMPPNDIYLREFRLKKSSMAELKKFVYLLFLSSSWAEMPNYQTQAIASMKNAAERYYLPPDCTSYH